MSGQHSLRTDTIGELVAIIGKRLSGESDAEQFRGRLGKLSIDAGVHLRRRQRVEGDIRNTLVEHYPDATAHSTQMEALIEESLDALEARCAPE